MSSGDNVAELIREVQGEHATEMEKDGPVKTKKAEKDVMAAERELNQREDTGIDWFPFEKMYRRDNVRTPQTLQLEAMVKSLKEKGFKRQYPLVISLKKDGRALVLCGNRRHEGLEIIFKEDPDLLAQILGSAECLVPCIIHKGLTEEEEIILRIDHAEDEDRVPLDKWGEFLAVKQLVRAGYDTQANIAKKMRQFNRKGEPDRSWAQVRVNLARLPDFIQREFQKLLTDGNSATKVRMNMIPELFELWNEEFGKGYTTQPGPKLMERWNSILNPNEEDLEGGAPTPSTPRTVTAGQLQEIAKRFDSRIVRKCCLRAASMPTSIDEGGKPKVEEWSEIVAEALQAEAAEEALQRVSNFMGAREFGNMMKEIDAAIREGKPVKMTKTFARQMSMFLEDMLAAKEESAETDPSEVALKEQVLDVPAREAMELAREVGADVMSKDAAAIQNMQAEDRQQAGDNAEADAAQGEANLRIGDLEASRRELPENQLQEGEGKAQGNQPGGGNRRGQGGRRGGNR